MKKLLTILAVAVVLAVPQARAEMIRIDDPDREALKMLLERPELARELEKYGISAQAARERVDAMTPEEVRSLAGRIDTLAAGGQTRTETLLLIILVVLLVLLIV
jgi:hypothetical protein